MPIAPKTRFGNVRADTRPVLSQARDEYLSGVPGIDAFGGAQAKELAQFGKALADASAFAGKVSHENAEKQLRNDSIKAYGEYSTDMQKFETELGELEGEEARNMVKLYEEGQETRQKAMEEKYGPRVAERMSVDYMRSRLGGIQRMTKYRQGRHDQEVSDMTALNLDTIMNQALNGEITLEQANSDIMLELLEIPGLSKAAIELQFRKLTRGMYRAHVDNLSHGEGGAEAARDFILANPSFFTKDDTELEKYQDDINKLQEERNKQIAAATEIYDEQIFDQQTMAFADAFIQKRDENGKLLIENVADLRDDPDYLRIDDLDLRVAVEDRFKKLAKGIQDREDQRDEESQSRFWDIVNSGRNPIQELGVDHKERLKAHPDNLWNKLVEDYKEKLEDDKVEVETNWTEFNTLKSMAESGDPEQWLEFGKLTSIAGLGRMRAKSQSKAEMLRIDGFVTNVNKLIAGQEPSKEFKQSTAAGKYIESTFFAMGEDMAKGTRATPEQNEQWNVWNHHASMAIEDAKALLEVKSLNPVQLKDALDPLLRDVLVTPGKWKWPWQDAETQKAYTKYGPRDQPHPMSRDAAHAAMDRLESMAAFSAAGAVGGGDSGPRGYVPDHYNMLLRLDPDFQLEDRDISAIERVASQLVKDTGNDFIDLTRAPSDVEPVAYSPSGGTMTWLEDIAIGALMYRAGDRSMPDWKQERYRDAYNAVGIMPGYRQQKEDDISFGPIGQAKTAFWDAVSSMTPNMTPNLKFENTPQLKQHDYNPDAPLENRAVRQRRERQSR